MMYNLLGCCFKRRVPSVDNASLSQPNNGYNPMWDVGEEVRVLMNSLASYPMFAKRPSAVQGGFSSS
eukprot:4206250-Amphidinium_carterae.1